MCQYCKHREVAVISPKWINEKLGTISSQRCLVVERWDIIPKIMNFKKDFGTPYVNWYHSLALYNNSLPFRTFKIGKEEKELWKKIHWVHMIGYDFVLDLDVPSFDSEIWDIAENDKNAILEWFKLHEVPCSLRQSGQGWHFYVPYEYMPTWVKQLSFDPHAKNNIYQLYYKIAKWFYSSFSEMIDTGIYDSRRVIKIPHSIAIYEDREVECLELCTVTGTTAFDLCEVGIDG